MSIIKRMTVWLAKAKEAKRRENLQRKVAKDALLAEVKAVRHRENLIKSAQRKFAQDGSARRVTSDEWNALSYKPWREALEATRLPDHVIESFKKQ